MTPLLAHGDRVPVSELGGAWSAEPIVLAVAALALGLFAQAFVRLRRRGRSDHAGWSRAALFGTGVAIGVLAVSSPLDAVGEEYLISAHMTQHLLLGDVVPALLLLALRGPLLFFFLPPGILGPLAGAGWLRAALSFLLRPRVSFAAWALGLAVWHVPAAYDLVLTRQWAHDLQHTTFLVGGLLAWTQLVDPARRGVPTVAGRIAFAVGMFVCGTILADVLVFSFEPLYPAYALQDERLLGLSPLTDQRLAGVAMMVEQLVTLGICVALLLRARERTARRRTAAAAAR
jgi:cytochrome c oxidase assembly factor CtaG